MGEQNKEKAEFEVERVVGSSSSAPAYGDETIFQSIRNILVRLNARPSSYFPLLTENRQELHVNWSDTLSFSRRYASLSKKEERLSRICLQVITFATSIPTQTLAGTTITFNMNSTNPSI